MAGRHSAVEDRRSRLVPALAVLVSAAVIGVGGFALVGVATPQDEPKAACEGTVTVQLAAAPEIAPALGEGARDLEAAETAVGGVCVRYEVEAVSPEVVDRVLTAEPEDSPDLWVPDFSVWLTRTEQAGT
ncbi:MAG TPA: hypothetical protein VFZ64_13275, partial [Nocardioidaceae bacterium]